MKTSVKLCTLIAALLLMVLFGGFESHAKPAGSKTSQVIKDKCPECNGNGKCRICYGAGTLTCDVCKGSGEEGKVLNADGTTTRLQCYRCSGRGEGQCYACKSSPGACSYCNGSGKNPY